MTKAKLTAAVKLHKAAGYADHDALVEGVKNDPAQYSDEDQAAIVAGVEAKEEEAAKDPLPLYDIWNVQAVRKPGVTKVSALKLISIEKSIPLADHALEEFNSFTVNVNGQRAYPQKDSKLKAGDEIAIK